MSQTQSTPVADRRQVTIFGNANAGKSTLFNAILGQELALVSPERGTTADPVTKAMELIPYGPVALTDTAGLDDTGLLGGKRAGKARAMLERTDFALYAADIDNFSLRNYANIKTTFKSHDIPHLLVFTKCDIASHAAIRAMTALYPDALTTSQFQPESIAALKARLGQELLKLGAPQEETLLGDLLPAGNIVVLVTPIDSEAPKGRLIQPQVMVLRDCLDHHMICLVTQPAELPAALAASPKVDLVITDSQAFGEIAAATPEGIPLTSFSMVLARQKGEMDAFLAGAAVIPALHPNDRVLMAEACTHASTHEDIGRVKLPKLLEKAAGGALRFEYAVAHDFPDDLSDYKLVIHCGACMFNRKLVVSRVEKAKEAGVPMTNYGVALAYLADILDKVELPR